MAAKQVREIFNLPKNENVYDDFSCSYGSFPGRIYLSTNYLCFFSTLLGKVTKIIINFENVSKLYKSNNKFSKSIKVHRVLEADGEQIYKFYGFSDRDITFKYVHRLWSNASPYAKDDESEVSEASEGTPPPQIPIEPASSVSEEFKDTMDVNFDEMLDLPIEERHHRTVKYKSRDKLDI